MAKYLYTSDIYITSDLPCFITVEIDERNQINKVVRIVSVDFSC